MDVELMTDLPGEGVQCERGGAVVHAFTYPQEA